MVNTGPALTAASGWCAPSEVIYQALPDFHSWLPTKYTPLPANKERAFRWAAEDMWLAAQWQLAGGKLYDLDEPPLLDLSSITVKRSDVWYPIRHKTWTEYAA